MDKRLFRRSTLLSTVYRISFFVFDLPDLPYLAVALEMLGKFAVTAGTSLMYVYVAELYPTVLRNTATGACSILSRVGASMSSFLFNLGE